MCSTELAKSILELDTLEQDNGIFNGRRFKNGKKDC
jgi:hypothetical protein